MKRHTRSYLLIFSCALFSLLFLAHSCAACSVFCIDKGGELVIGRNYDWGFGEGMVVINKKNQTKTALRYWEESTQNLARWKSKYGSITFVQYGRDIAFGGMNETGLVVHELWLDGTQYPASDGRASLSVDQYVQYILDNFHRVDEIPASDQLIRLRPTTNDFTKIHFFAVDSAGKSIVIEFLGGKMVFHSKKAMPVKVMTNHTYEQSIAYLKNKKEPNLNSITSLDRFANAAALTAKYDPANPDGAVTYAFNVLDAVRQGTGTKFQTVFDVKKRVIYFKSLSNPKLRYFQFNSFDFSSDSPSLLLDLNADLAGDVTSKFRKYSTQANEDLIQKAWEDLGFTSIYMPALQLISRYPETFINN